MTTLEKDSTDAVIRSISSMQNGREKSSRGRIGAVQRHLLTVLKY